MSRRVLCKFFVRGTCLKGESCGYSHQLKVPPHNICSFYHKGVCAYGDQCKYAHTEVSEMQSSALSASAADVNATVTTEIPAFIGSEVGESSGCENMPENECSDDDMHSEALSLSEKIECNVCLDLVLSKTTAEERQFGILSGCDHAFCIICIRRWRKHFRPFTSSGNPRVCPICRQFSFFVIPSKVWYTTREEKMEIIDNYKAKLSSIDCKHFDFGNGTCPFRTNCFYKHIVQPGSLLWNAAMGQDLFNSRVLELSSRNFNMRDVVAHLNDSKPPLESEELENGNDDDFDDLLSEIWAFSMDDDVKESC